MVETLAPDDGDGVAAAARLLHDFNREYDEPSPPPDRVALRLTELVTAGDVTVLLAREPSSGTPVGVAVMRVQPAIIGEGQEVYLAELYVVPERRGRGFGRELITDALARARGRGADYAYLITSEEDERAQRLYEAAGFRRTEGDGGPVMLAYEREL